MGSQRTALIPAARIGRKISRLRSEKVMLDGDLAQRYGVETKVVNQAVQRNLDRCPPGFMFRLSSEEATSVLRSQFVTSNVETSGKGKQIKGLAIRELTNEKKKSKRRPDSTPRCQNPPHRPAERFDP